MSDFITFEMYNGEVKGKFFTESHQYWVNGKRPPSVTGILNVIDKSRALVPWALEEAVKSLLPRLNKKLTASELVKACFASEEKKTAASDLGTKIHEWCEEFIRSELGQAETPAMPTDKAILTGANAFLDWVMSHKVEFVSTERVVYSKEHNYIGTLDIEAVVDGERCLIDLKSSNGLYNTVRMQTAAYAKADEEERGQVYAGRWAIRLAKETEQEYYDRMELKNQIKVFLGKNQQPIKDYQVFEAKQFMGREELESDYKAFLAAKSLQEWNNKTNFYAREN